ncbi:unnamed protein product [Fructobacillus fructosus]|uniref:hypothetical protein n=1 Tax=Fructobacillus fructosus TaxID=1631 RepID=UPI002D99CEFA|nr:unnamed protein product [Fructobacillus fructosus]
MINQNKLMQIFDPTTRAVTRLNKLKTEYRKMDPKKLKEEIDFKQFAVDHTQSTAKTISLVYPISTIVTFIIGLWFLGNFYSSSSETRRIFWFTLLFFCPIIFSGLLFYLIYLHKRINDQNVLISAMKKILSEEV